MRFSTGLFAAVALGLVGFFWTGGAAVLAPRTSLTPVSDAAASTARQAREPRQAPAGARAQAIEYIGYYHSIKLTPEQEKIKTQALSAIPAPCCKDYTAATCCCPCNLAKAVWGLSHHLIAKKGYGAARVKTAVQEWLRSTNPAGYAGDACYTGGCQRPFAQNGCGGMDERTVL